MSWSAQNQPGAADAMGGVAHGPLLDAAGSCGMASEVTFTPSTSAAEYNYQLCWAPNAASRFASVLLPVVKPVLLAIHSADCAAVGGPAAARRSEVRTGPPGRGRWSAAEGTAAPPPCGRG